MYLKLEMLRDQAEAANERTLAYMIECSMREARRISDQARRDAEAGDSRPDDLWRPV